MRNAEKCILLLLIIILSSCTSKVEKKLNSDANLLKIDWKHVSNVIDYSPMVEDSVLMFHLETNDSCLIGEITKLICLNNLIYIADNISKSIFVFDMSGKLRTKIHSVGSGPGEYTNISYFTVHGTDVILFDHYMAMNPGYVEEEITGIPTFEPSFNLPAIWITESQRERAESLGYTVVDPPSIIATHLTEVIRNNLNELLTRQDVQNLINNIQEANTTLISELVPKMLSVGEIQKVLQNLLEEGISIRDLVTIFETLADNAATTRDTDVLTEYVRQSLKRAISNKYFPTNEMTSVVTLDPKIEQEIMGSVKQTEQGAYINLAPEKTQSILNSVKEEVDKMEELGKNPIIVTSPIVRMYFKKITSEQFKDLIVVSYNEIDTDVELQSIGMVTV